MIWKLLKDYVREFEIANDCKFEQTAWDRIKKLHQDILDCVDSETRSAEQHQKRETEHSESGGDDAISG